MANPIDTFERYLKNIGGAEISSGTLRPQDLIGSFLSTIDDIEPAAAKDLRNQVEALLAKHQDDVDSAYEGEEMGYILDDARTKLESLAPPGFWFGGSEGDPASIGFWKIDPRDR